MNTIDYTPSLADRRSLSSTFGVDLASVPKRLTGGRVNDAATGVLFMEGAGGYRFELAFTGRPSLEKLAKAGLAARKRAA